MFVDNLFSNPSTKFKTVLPSDVGLKAFSVLFFICKRLQFGSTRVEAVIEHFGSTRVEAVIEHFGSTRVESVIEQLGATQGNS